MELEALGEKLHQLANKNCYQIFEYVWEEAKLHYEREDILNAFIGAKPPKPTMIVNGVDIIP